MSSACFQHRLQFCYGQEKQLVYVPAFSKTNKVSIGFKSCSPRNDAYVGGFTKIFWFISQTWTMFLLKSSTLGGTTSSLTRPQNNNWKWKNNHAVRAARTLANFPTLLSRITDMKTMWIYEGNRLFSLFHAMLILSGHNLPIL